MANEIRNQIEFSKKRVLELKGAGYSEERNHHKTRIIRLEKMLKKLA